MTTDTLSFFDDPSQKQVIVDIDDVLSLQQHGSIYTIVHLIDNTFYMASRPDFETLRHLYKTRKQRKVMKFKQYLALISDPGGFVPTPRFHWDIRTNTRKTAREEAIAAEIIEQANPRENITGHFPWGPEQQMVLQQLWVHPERELAVWRDVPTKGDSELYSVEQTEHGELPVPNAVKEPGTIRGSFLDRIKEALGEDE
jgi:hypothetical protein